MREILFRGKHAVSGEWIYGDLLCSKGNYYIHERGKPIVSYVPPMAAFGTVGEWTGLKDKNGKKIFEGDIVRYAYLDEYRCYLESLESPEDYEGCNFDNMWTIDVVVYCINIGYPAFDLNGHDWEVNGLSNLSESTEYYFEVIGNVHDNPELLEVEK